MQVVTVAMKEVYQFVPMTNVPSPLKMGSVSVRERLTLMEYLIHVIRILLSVLVSYVPVLILISSSRLISSINKEQVSLIARMALAH